MDLRAAVGLALFACTPAQAPHSVPGEFLGTDGASHPLVDPKASFTVVEFFSAHCPCQAKHDERLRSLAASYRDQAVAVVAIDSEADATPSRDAAEATRRRYAYPILVDPDGVAARALKADYATYSLLLDRTGQVLFRGGIDSDQTHLRDDATPYLQNAIDDALAGRPIRLSKARTLGCSLVIK
ncbi:MAG TPA: redoxin family protein [Polyangiaceae bacterium]|nr:redoxin family protein [Polyangiaceae bacterium]